MIPTGQDKQEHDDETLAEAIQRYADEKAEQEPLLANQGKLEGGIDEPKV